MSRFSLRISPRNPPNPHGARLAMPNKRAFKTLFLQVVESIHTPRARVSLFKSRNELNAPGSTMKLAKLVRKHFPKTNGVKANVHKQWVLTLARLKVAECNAKLMSLQRLRADVDAEMNKPAFVNVVSFHHKKVVQEERKGDYDRFVGFLNANASPAIDPTQMGRAFISCFQLKNGRSETYASINARCDIVVDAWVAYRSHWIEKIVKLDPSAKPEALTGITGGLRVAQSKEWKRQITAAEYQRALKDENETRAAIRQHYTAKNGFHGSASKYESWHKLDSAPPASAAFQDYHIITAEDEKEEREKKERKRRNKDEIDKLMGRETSEEKRLREERQENERLAKRSAKLSGELVKIIYGHPNPPMGAKRETEAGVVMLGHLNQNGSVRLVEFFMSESDDETPVRDHISEFEYGWQVARGGEDVRYLSGPKFLDWAEEELARVMGLRWYLG
jgi:hypothetical protein